MEYLVQQLVNGTGVGAQYALWCVGYGMVYQVLGLMHFAHGDTLVFSAFTGVTFMVLGAPFWVAMALAVMVAVVLAISIERFIYRPLISRELVFMAFVAAMAAGFVIRNLAQIGWGVQPRGFDEGILPSGSWDVAGVRIGYLPVLNLVVAIVVVVAFERFLHHSRHGQAILAVSQDRSTAELMGINVNRVIALVYGLSATIGMTGLLLYIANFRTLTIGLGFAITLKAFIAAIIGGIGSIRAALLGGMVLGITESMVSAYLSSTLMDATVFGLLVVFILVRPNGILGHRAQVKL